MEKSYTVRQTEEYLSQPLDPSLHALRSLCEVAWEEGSKLVQPGQPFVGTPSGPSSGALMATSDVPNTLWGNRPSSFDALLTYAYMQLRALTSDVYAVRGQYGTLLLDRACRVIPVGVGGFSELSPFPVTVSPAGQVRVGGATMEALMSLRDQPTHQSTPVFMNQALGEDLNPALTTGHSIENMPPIGVLALTSSHLAGLNRLHLAASREPWRLNQSEIRT